MSRVTYNNMPIIGARFVRSNQTGEDTFFLDCLRMWRKKTFKVKAKHISGFGKVQKLYSMVCIEEVLDIDSPRFHPGGVQFPVYNNTAVVSWETIPFLQPQSVLDYAERNEGPSVELIKKFYWYERSCKSPDMHGLTCSCPSLKDFELPLHTRVDDWLEKVNG